MTVSQSTHVPVESAHSGGALNVQEVHVEKATYAWILPDEVAAASKKYLAMFNAADSDYIVRILSIKAIPAIDTAVTVTVGVRFDLLKTSAAPTGGTAWNEAGTTLDGAGGSVNPLDSASGTIATLTSSKVTGRALYTSTPTVTAWINSAYVGQDEDGAPYTPFTELAPHARHGQLLTLRPGEGLKVEQGSVASAGQISFLVVFTIEKS